jgi:caspase domain-containing protein/tetratricopeptide repeat protein
MVLFALLLVPAQQASAQERSKTRYTEAYDKSWAVVIGIDAYRNVARLNYAAADAQAVTALLPALGFPRENTFLLLNDDATLSRIKDTFYVKLRQMGRNDRLLVYFAGHGETEQIRDGEEGYILPVDASPDNLAGTAIAMDEIQRITQRLRAKHYLFLLDACFSGFAVTRSALSKGGEVPDDYYANARREPVTQVITAGRKGEVVIEKGGHGIFTKRLLDGLRGLADTEGRGLISATQLFAWIEPRVIVDSDKRMTPQYSKLDGEGQFIFALRSGAHRPAATDLTGTFTGMVEGFVNGRKYQMPVTVTFVQRAKNLSGTWSTAAGSSGGITGIVEGSNIRAFKVNQSNPCVATFGGTASAQGGQNALVGSYSGTDCNGNVIASFRVTRIDREQRLDDSPLEFSDLMNVGSSYFGQRRYDDAIDYFQQARDVAETKHDDRGQMTALVFVGAVRNAQGLDGDAIRSLRRAQDLADQLGNKLDQAIIANQIGMVHMSKKRYTEAQREFERGLLLAQQAESDTQQAHELYNLGYVALEQQRHSEALALFDRAMEKAAGLSEPERENIRQKRDETRRQIQR